MKKHLIVAGPPRAGKSTLSSLLAGRFGYQYLCMDGVVDALAACFPEIGLDSRELPDLDALQAMSRRLAPFLAAMMAGGEYDELGYGMVLDICQLFPRDCVEHLDPELCQVIFLVTAAVTPEERYQLLLRHDRPKDYTYGRPPEENRALAACAVEQSRLVRAQCRELGLPCLETSRHRDRLLPALADFFQREGRFPRAGENFPFPR